MYASSSRIVPSWPNYLMENEIILPVRKQRLQGQLLTVADVAVACGCAYTTVLDRLRRGVMPERVLIGKRLYWKGCQLDAVVAAILAPLPLPSKRYKPPAKLDAEGERELASLRACGFNQRELGELVGLSQGQVSRILAKVKS